MARWTLLDRRILSITLSAEPARSLATGPLCSCGPVVTGHSGAARYSKTERTADSYKLLSDTDITHALRGPATTRTVPLTLGGARCRRGITSEIRRESV